MSAILSSDDLNDFISPGIACIKPVEVLPPQAQGGDSYEVVHEGQHNDDLEKAKAAQISLTDCLACSGCVTSAEAVLVSLQSHMEVLNMLKAASSGSEAELVDLNTMDENIGNVNPSGHLRQVFVASVSPQTIASLAAMLSVTKREARNMVDHLLLSRVGSSGGRNFDFVLDTDSLLSVCLHLAAKEVKESTKVIDNTPVRPILTSECPGFVCYLEKTHPTILSHLSRLKSPQALLGTLIKSTLPKLFDDRVQIKHVAIMPCFDKKLEASRAELTNQAWDENEFLEVARDADCVITTKEIVLLASTLNIDITAIPRISFINTQRLPAPIDEYFARSSPLRAFNFTKRPGQPLTGTSGGYLAYILESISLDLPGSTVVEQKGRGSDVHDYILLDQSGKEVVRMGRYYGFRNIQNLIRRLKPAKVRRLPRSNAGTVMSRASISSKPSDGGSPGYAYVEVMACPGGCTNGGGQLKANDQVLLETELQHDIADNLGSFVNTKEWLQRVDEAYFSADENDQSDISMQSSTSVLKNHEQSVKSFLDVWASICGVALDKLVYTSYRSVESNVGKSKIIGAGEHSAVQIAEIAGKQGGGW